MRKICAALAFFSLFTTTIRAQRQLGVSTGSWGGTTSLSLNPANVADSRHRLVVELFSVNGLVDNDGATLNPSGAFKTLFSGDSSRLTSIFNFKDGSTFNLTAPYAEVRGPGAQLSFGRHGIALTTRVRGFLQFDDFNQQLYRTILDESYRDVSGDFSLQSGRFGWNTHVWSDLGLSYGLVLLQKGRHFLKGGFTAHYLTGVGYTSFRGSRLDAQYFSAQDSIRVSNTDAAFSSNIIANDQELSNGLSGSLFSDYFFGSKGGRGLGLDLGFVYEYRPHPENTRYTMDGREGLYDRSAPSHALRLSVAVTDIGAIRYRRNSYQATINGDATFKASDLAGRFSTFNEFQAYARERGLTVTYDSGRSTSMALPTAVVLGADVHLYRRLWLAATYIGNVADRSAVGNYHYSQLTLTPRYDSRLFSIGVPVTYSTLTRQMKLGVGARVSGFYAGSDDLLALLDSNSQTGLNAYVGAFVPINRRRPRDRDRDGVSDRYDRCPQERGTWEDRGCPPPDADGDGLPDAEDNCPEEAGSFALDGCPDRDGDGVADGEDRCPDEAGLSALRGCPDRDGDGVADGDDACPSVAGQVRFEGCPDRDEDGIPDPKDRCPEVPGLPANGGCPEVPTLKPEVRQRLAYAGSAIQFETGKAVLRKTSNGVLDEVAGILQKYEGYSLTLEGHTDNTGSAAQNLTLSKARAEAVKAALVARGIPPERLAARGYGQEVPVATNKTAAGRAKNRRVVLELKPR